MKNVNIKQEVIRKKAHNFLNQRCNYFFHFLRAIVGVSFIAIHYISKS